jgi:hypothetical protein
VTLRIAVTAYGFSSGNGESDRLTGDHVPADNAALQKHPVHLAKRSHVRHVAVLEMVFRRKVTRLAVVLGVDTLPLYLATLILELHDALRELPRSLKAVDYCLTAG